MSIYTRHVARLKKAEANLAYREKQAAYWSKRKAKAKNPSTARRHARHMLDGRLKLVAAAQHDVIAERKIVARHKPQPLRLRAYVEAAKRIGVMESLGNNRGPDVERIIRANDGAVGEPWCGDFMAYVYRLAGSKAVERRWAAVRLIGALAGIRRVSTPLRGDLVTFTFDHVGMFSRDLGGGFIETIEGNTGASGAVSDSSTGGDGVYRKRRHVSLVSAYFRVSR